MEEKEQSKAGYCYLRVNYRVARRRNHRVTSDEVLRIPLGRDP